MDFSCIWSYSKWSGWEDLQEICISNSLDVNENNANVMIRQWHPFWRRLNHMKIRNRSDILPQSHYHFNYVTFNNHIYVAIVDLCFLLLSDFHKTFHVMVFKCLLCVFFHVLHISNCTQMYKCYQLTHHNLLYLL